MKESSERLLHRISKSSPNLLKNRKVAELVRVYEDLEKLIRNLKSKSSEELNQINVRKLLDQLSESKTKLERKIGNTLLLEKDVLTKKIKSLSRQIIRRDLPN